MKDPRFDRLAQVLIQHSTRLQAGENILIEATDVPSELTVAIVRAAQAVGANPMINVRQSAVTRALFQGATDDSMLLNGRVGLHQMQQVQAYIAIRGADNAAELSDISSDKMKLYTKHWMHPVHMEHRVKKTKWVVLRYPSPSMAQEAKMSTEAFEDFFFDVCTFDYSRMEEAVKPLVERMGRADHVRISGPGTDLEFSIKDIGVVPCFGERNIPDGECFTAPVKDSVNGTLQYNTPTIEHGFTHENVRLVFKDGKIIEATGSDSKKLNEVLDTDDGARFIGEWSLAYNPYILNPMKDILFDEKIAGSFHFTPGQAYEDADNGNRSEVHWDMVCIQRPEYGGGEIYFDGELIRKDGLFVPDALQALNPDRLKGV